MEQPVITLEGKGSIHVVPDVTRLEVTVEQWFATYTQAYARAKENSAWMAKILEYNHKPGSLAKSIRLDISDYTRNVYDDKGHFDHSEKDGVMLEQKIKVDLPMDKVLVNRVVRGVGKFIPDAQINIGYTLQDPRPCELKMLARAVADAREKAAMMVEAAGCRLGRLLSIKHDYTNVTTYSEARNIHSNAEAKASTSQALDITPDDLVMSDRVSAEFEILNPEII